MNIVPQGAQTRGLFIHSMNITPMMAIMMRVTYLYVTSVTGDNAYQVS